MRKTSRLFIFVALILVLLTTACGADAGATPTTLVGTLLPEMTSTPLGGIAINTQEGTILATEPAVGGLETATGVVGLETPTSGVSTQDVGALSPGTSTTQTPIVPVTGEEEIMLVECQFCVDTRANALLVLPDTATFKIVSPAPNTTTSTTQDMQPACTTVEVNNGRQVVLCSGPEMTPLVVNICTNGNTCTDFPVDLLACPLSQGGAVNPGPTQAAPGTGNTNNNTNISTNTPAAPTLDPGVVISTATP